MWYFFRDLAKEFRAFAATSKAKNPSAAKYKNTVSEPMIDGEDDERISDYLAPPELHLHTGTVNKHNRELNEKWGGNQFYKWCAKKNIQVSMYLVKQCLNQIKSVIC